MQTVLSFFLYSVFYSAKESKGGSKKNLVVKGLWKIIRQIKGFPLLLQIISFNFADNKSEL